MNLITNVYNPSELDGFSYAFIELTPELAKIILRRRDAFKAIPADNDGELRSIEYRDYSPVYLSGVPEGTELPNCDAGGDFDETTLTAEELENYAERTDCDRMVITSDAVYWTAYAKYTDRAITCETNQIDFATVEKAASVVAA